MKKIWFDKAWDDYLEWHNLDKKALKKIHELIKDIERHPFEGIGKPEPLKEDMSGFWSRHINHTDRLVYRITGNMLEIASCKGHYDK